MLATAWLRVWRVRVPPGWVNCSASNAHEVPGWAATGFLPPRVHDKQYP